MAEKIEKINLWMPIAKSKTGSFVAILSDTSIDRDDEIVGREAFEKWMEIDYLPILVDHANKIENMIGYWVNKRIVESSDGHYAFIAEPKFFSEKANPLAGQVKRMLEEGGQLGVSIGALPKAWEYVDIDGKRVKKYTEVELLEASFVPVPANRHAYAILAKQFNLEGDNMVENIEKAEVTNREWEAPPQSVRNELPDSYFLLPREKKFPYREWRGADKGKINCNALRAAIVRAAQHGYREVYNKARKLYQQYCAKEKCSEIDILKAFEEILWGDKMAEEVKKNEELENKDVQEPVENQEEVKEESQEVQEENKEESKEEPKEEAPQEENKPEEEKPAEENKEASAESEVKKEIDESKIEEVVAKVLEKKLDELLEKRKSNVAEKKEEVKEVSLGEVFLKAIKG